MDANITTGNAAKDMRRFNLRLTNLSMNLRLTPALVMCLLVMAIASGCNRAFYREQADRDAYELISEKTHNPHWHLTDYSINVDPRSRMYDPFAPDCEPMPPDDPASHALMHYVDDKHGWPKWHANGDTNLIENPMWMQFLPTREDGVVELDQRTAVRVALLNSPSFQSNLEELYLSALDVSFERFLFDSQFFAGYQGFFTAANTTSGVSSSQLDLATRGVQVNKMFAAGGELVVGLANELIFEFSGPDTNIATTLLDFTFIQPLLRGGGRDVVMERLTLSERTLLANVRQMERFRRGFYLEITTGRDGGNGPTRRGGLFGGAGLQGFTGLGGGFGRLGGGGGGTGGGDASGFLGLLQDQMIIRNEVDNIAGLKSNLYRLETLLAENQASLTVGEEPQARREGILQSALQVAQARQALFNAESRLINLRNAYEAQLDSYKTTLGLSPDICIEIKDPLLERLNLISDTNRQQRYQLDALANQLSEAAAGILAEAKDVRGEDGALQNRALPWSNSLVEKLEQIKGSIAPLKERVALVNEEIVTNVQKDVRLLDEAIPDRIADLRRLRELQAELNEQSCPLLLLDQVDDAILDERRLEQLPANLQKDLEDTIIRLETYPAELDAVQAEIEALEAAKETETDINRLRRVRDNIIIKLQQIFSSISDDLLTLQVIQARARTDTVRLPPIDIRPDQALQIAAQYRRDWMNARASLVDTWRLIQFNANDLESDLDLVISGGVGNISGNGISVTGESSNIRAGLQFDSALTRLGERNNYRQALIEYQQARRNYYSYIDAVSQSLRSTLRTMLANRYNFEMRRFAVQVAAEQIILNDAILEQRQGQSSGATAARDAVSALSDLQSAQNDFLSVWINYEVLRRVLDFDLGTMTLDRDGVWIDPGEIGPNHMPLDLAACLAAEYPDGLPEGIPELLEGLPGDDNFPENVLEVLPAPNVPKQELPNQVPGQFPGLNPAENTIPGSEPGAVPGNRPRPIPDSSQPMRGELPPPGHRRDLPDEFPGEIPGQIPERPGESPTREAPPAGLMREDILRPIDRQPFPVRAENLFRDPD